MKARAPYQLPPAHARELRRAVRIAWLSVGVQLSTVGIMALVMTGSQAMRTAWLEDTLSLVPPLAFLISERIRARPPDQRYPYGRHRVSSIAFLVAAIALFAFGLVLVCDALATLLRAERPTIGFVHAGGHTVWLGWLMIAALVYSIVPPIVLGRYKLPLARALHLKVLHADATMNKADWMTGTAAIGGVLGVGMGWWWADAVSAGAISFSVLKDGYGALRTVLADLMDHTPRAMDQREHFDLPERLRVHFASLDWVQAFELRLREEGDVCVGEVFVLPRPDTDALPRRIERAVEAARALDWRLYDLVVMPIASLSEAPLAGGGTKSVE